MELEPPPFMEKSILNFHFDYLHPSIINNDFDSDYGQERSIDINHH